MSTHHRTGVTNHHHSKGDVVNASPLPCDLKRGEVSQTGSARLREAVLRAFLMFERTHGLEPGEGRILLLQTGLQPRRRAA